jgi:hypothetical protein
MNIFYDIEVYTHNAFVVFKDENKITMRIFKDDDRFNGLTEFVKGHTLIGFNNYWYDDHVLCAMMDRKPMSDIKKLNDRIIGGEKQRAQDRFRSLDVFQQIDVSKPSLKKIEANMGSMILESSIPFDIPTRLDPEQYKEALAYCSYDVDKTIDIWHMRKNSYFAPKQSLVDMVGKGERWNTTTLSANALLSNSSVDKWYSIRLSGDNWRDLSLLDMAPQEVVELWTSGKTKGKVKVEEFGCSIEFGFGGLHGVNKTTKKVKNMKLLDVASMYPHIILIIKALGDMATEKYRDILQQRIAVKHTDKTLSDALKLILNSVYGNLGSEYSSLYNPKAQLSVCIYGQIALYNLCKRLAQAGHEIININTDGVGFVPNGDYQEIWHQWERDFSLTLEEDSFDYFHQKDVNNYIGVKGDSIKVKGGDVGRYDGDQYFKNNSARILDIAIVDYLLDGKPVVDTLIENLDNPKLYQFVIQAGRTFQGTFDTQGNKYNRVNRVFPTKSGDLCLYKKRSDDGLVRFPDLPEKMFIWNDDCDKLENFDRIVDLNHYITIINKKLERWT